MAGVLLSACVAGCSTASSPQLAVRIANYGPYEEDGYAHVKSLGVRYVFIPVPPADEVKAVEQKLAAHGLQALVMRGKTDLSKETCVDELAGQLAICRQMGVKYMFLSAKLNGADRNVVCDRLRKAGDAAATNGVTIVLETHPELGTNGDVHRQTMQAIGHPNVRVNFDTGNITYYNRNTTAPAELAKVLDCVATVEIKDHNGQFETWNFPPLGKGAVDIPAVLRMLREHHYAGPVTIEIEGVKGQERSEDRIKSDIAESVAYLRSLQSFR